MKNYPIYRRSQFHWYKIYSDENAVQVYDGYDCGIYIVGNSNGFYTSDIIINEPSNEGEFLEKYYSVRRKLDQISLIQIDK